MKFFWPRLSLFKTPLIHRIDWHMQTKLNISRSWSQNANKHTHTQTERKKETTNKQTNKKNVNNTNRRRGAESIDWPNFKNYPCKFYSWKLVKPHSCRAIIYYYYYYYTGGWLTGGSWKTRPNIFTTSFSPLCPWIVWQRSSRINGRKSQ